MPTFRQNIIFRRVVTFIFLSALFAQPFLPTRRARDGAGAWGVRATAQAFLAVAFSRRARGRDLAVPGLVIGQQHSLLSLFSLPLPAAQPTLRCTMGFTRAIGSSFLHAFHRELSDLYRRLAMSLVGPDFELDIRAVGYGRSHAAE